MSESTKGLAGIEGTVVSAEEAARQTLERKLRLGIFDYDELRNICYPTPFTAVFNYAATGEGLTVGLLMDYASNEEQLKNKMTEAFGGYFALGAEVVVGYSTELCSQFVPPALQRFIDGYCAGERQGNFFYKSVYHINLS